MALDTVIQQGRFTADGNAKVLQIRSDFDYIEVFNETAAYQGAADLGARFEFWRGMTSGRGVVYTKLGTVGSDPLTVGQIAAAAGFTMLDSTVNRLGASLAFTNITNANPDVFTVASTAGLATGDVVRVFNANIGNSLNGYDFGIHVINGTTFAIPALQNAVVGAGGAATGTIRRVNFDPIFVPPYRTIVNITLGNPTIVALSAPSFYAVGQEVIFNIPSASWGTIELDGLVGTITAVTNTPATPIFTISVNIDSTGFTAFAFPAHNDAFRKERAVVAPVGINTGYVLGVNGNILNDAMYNTNYIGVRLEPGTLSPAGQVNDVIYWRACKAFSVTNE
jgi:hypothetical protein